MLASLPPFVARSAPLLNIAIYDFGDFTFPEIHLQCGLFIPRLQGEYHPDSRFPRRNSLTGPLRKHLEMKPSNGNGTRTDIVANNDIVEFLPAHGRLQVFRETCNCRRHEGESYSGCALSEPVSHLYVCRTIAQLPTVVRPS